MRLSFSIARGVTGPAAVDIDGKLSAGQAVQRAGNDRTVGGSAQHGIVLMLVFTPIPIAGIIHIYPIATEINSQAAITGNLITS